MILIWPIHPLHRRLPWPQSPWLTDSVGFNSNGRFWTVRNGMHFHPLSRADLVPPLVLVRDNSLLGFSGYSFSKLWRGAPGSWEKSYTCITRKSLLSSDHGHRESHVGYVMQRAAVTSSSTSVGKTCSNPQTNPTTTSTEPRCVEIGAWSQRNIQIKLKSHRALCCPPDSILLLDLKCICVLMDVFCALLAYPVA